LNPMTLYHLGRMSSWLGSFVSAGMLKELPDAEGEIKDLIEKSKTANEKTVLYLYGAMLSWLESLTTSESDAPETMANTKPKIERLVMEAVRHLETVKDKEQGK